MSLCWRCNHDYPITQAQCPACSATNPNVDPEEAYRELEEQFARVARKFEPELPALLRVQAE